MFRRFTISVVACIALLAACGRQVTPSTSSNGILPGTMRVRFDTAAPMNFNLYRYAIVFNTSGNGQEPYANAFTTSLLNYSFVWIVGAQGSNSVAPTLEQIFPTNSTIESTYVAVPPSAVQLVLNSNGQNSEFTLQFQRALFYTQPPNASPSPSSTASAVPTTAPTTSSQQIWNVNVFTIDNNNTIIDAAGLGASDTSFQLQINTALYVDNAQPFNTAAAATVADQAAQISGGEIINSP